MERLEVIAAIVVLLGSLLLSNINDTSASVDAIPDDEITSREADKSELYHSTLSHGFDSKMAYSVSSALTLRC